MLRIATLANRSTPHASSFNRARPVRCAVLVAGICAVSSAVQAAVIVSYSFPGTSLAPTTLGPNVSASNISHANGLNGGVPSYFGTSSVGVPTDGILVRSIPTAATEVGAVAGNDYFTFTVTPTGGSDLDLGALTFDLVASNNSPTNFVGSVALRTSVDGFSSTLQTFDAPNAGPNTPDQSEWMNQALLLTGTQFQNLNSPVTFRFYLYDNVTENGDVFRFDNIVLHDVNFVPEPSTLAACSLLGLGLVARRRRRVRA